MTNNHLSVKQENIVEISSYTARGDLNNLENSLKKLLTKD